MQLCDICKKNPAVAKITTIERGKKRVLNLCEKDYKKFSGRRSPFESFFFEDPFESFLGFEDFEDLISRLGEPLPRHREAVEIEKFFSEHTKEVLQKAGEKALEFGREVVDTEHLLLALLDSPGVQSLLDKDLQPIKKEVELISPRKKAKKIKEGEEVELSVSPRVKNVLERSFSISREFGHSYIGPEHILIALAEEEDSLAFQVLNKFKLDSDTLRSLVLKKIGRGKVEELKESTTPYLDQFSRDLTHLAKEGKLDPVIGRTKEIETLIEVLLRRTKNNPVLIGEPGVGKTAIVEGLAQRIVNKEVPESLQNKRLVELNLNALIAGTKYRGELEERIKRILDEILANKENLILFVDEVHTLVGAGASEGGLDISNIIKPYLARGELHLIGATTLKEYQKYIEKDQALERRFQPIFVAEPTVEETVEILRGLRDRYEAHHKVKISDEAIFAAAELSQKYITGRFLPDKAIDLIDQAAARVRMRALLPPPELQELEDKILALKRELAFAESRKDYTRAKEIEAEIEKLTEEKEKLEKEWERKRGTEVPEVKKEDIFEIVSKLTGIPVGDIKLEEKEKLLNLEEKLKERVIGQDHAVKAVAEAVRVSRAGLVGKNRPLAVFMFLGPTGVGKTELAKALAKALFGSDKALVRLDMSEYSERHSVAKLIGAPPGYVGYEEGGHLTEAVRRRPYTVILLDEIEKAHPEVYNLLLQLFDEGRLTDSKGRTIDFTNTIIIATSNLGSELIQKEFEAGRAIEEIKKDILPILKTHFRPEFLNRIDEIVVFEPITQEKMEKIVKLRLAELQELAESKGVKLVFDKSLINYLVKEGFSSEFGARELNRAIKNKVASKIAEALIEGKFSPGDKVKVKFNSKANKIQITKA